jgi:hypothetical protein
VLENKENGRDVFVSFFVAADSCTQIPVLDYGVQRVSPHSCCQTHGSNPDPDPEPYFLTGIFRTIQG